MTTTLPRTDALRTAVRALVPQLQVSLADSDRHRQLPAAIATALRDAGVYRMLVPTALGGDEVDLQTLLDVVELVAEGNGAAGWDVATSAWATLVALTLPEAGVARIYAAGPDVAFAGSFAGGGRAIVTPGGYRVSGQWQFGSGCPEADWMLAGRWRVFEQEAPRANAQGQPEFRFALLPHAEVTVHDTWQVAGLRGTGSHDWSLADVVVPAALTQVIAAPSPWPGPLYRLSYTTVINALHFSAVATGIARRAIDSLTELAQQKTPAGPGGLLRERVQVQEAVARAEVLLEAARTYR